MNRTLRWTGALAGLALAQPAFADTSLKDLPARIELADGRGHAASVVLAAGGVRSTVLRSAP